MDEEEEEEEEEEYEDYAEEDAEALAAKKVCLGLGA